MFAVRIFDVEKLKKAKYPVIISSLILLALVFVPKLGVESFGAKRWINLGFFTIQPSEYAKFGFVIFAAAVCADDNVNNTKTLLKILFFGVFSCILIILEPNMSITVCLGAVMLVMLYVGGLKTKSLRRCLRRGFCNPRAYRCRAVPYEKASGISESVGKPERRGIPTHTKLLCFGQRRFFRARISQQQTKIFVPAVFGK